MNYLSACAIFKDEAPYLFEWLAFHKMVGFEYFYLYDNGSTDNFLPAIQAALPEGNYELIPWPRRPGQHPAYDDCLARARGKTRWLAFFDIDEFLFSPRSDDLRPMLEPFEPHPGVVSNWVYFGSAGHQHAPDDYVTRAYRRRCFLGFTIGKPGMLKHPALDPKDLASYYPQCGHYKSIVDPARTRRCVNAHLFDHGDGRSSVRENGEPVRTKWTTTVLLETFRINHYWSRSLADLAQKSARGRVADDKVDPLPDLLRMESLMNRTEDLVIQPLAAKLPDPRPRF